MQKAKQYFKTLFAPSVIREAHKVFLSRAGLANDIPKFAELCVIRGDECWSFDDPAEFYAECPTSSYFRFDHIFNRNRIIVEHKEDLSTRVVVAFEHRSDIEAVFQVFESNATISQVIVESGPLHIFIGHGHDTQWRDLKDHLHDQHDFDIVAYEVGPRAGRSVKEVLEEMAGESNFALLVLTGEDQHSDGETHARENVIHELGLFQGKLGFTKAIALLEDGVNEFSNVLGINQIRFSKGNIRETFGDVLATIKREFGESAK